MRHSSTLIGGVFIILATAMALTSFLVDAQVPDPAAKWAVAHIGSPILFLLGLNLILLIAGCVMDVFSAIAVLTPPLLPIGAQFGISPVQSGDQIPAAGAAILGVLRRAAPRVIAE